MYYTGTAEGERNKKMKTNIALQDVIESLRKQITIEQVIDHLDLIKKLNLEKKGNEIQGDCITGHPSQGHHCFSITPDLNIFNCFSCDITGDIIELVQLSEDMGKLEAMKLLAEQFAQEIYSQIQELEEDLPEEKKEILRRAKYSGNL